jgi:glycerophosphoryl diester phosphodiesterase
MTGQLLAVAHRAGNDLPSLREALRGGVDLVEADVHAYRGRLEIRHHKSLGPWWLWDHGEFVRRPGAPLLELRHVLEALGGDSRLMLDLKGLHPTLAGKVSAAFHELSPGTPFTVCTQHWWMLNAFRAFPQLRVVLSAGSRRGLKRLLARLHEAPAYGVSVHRELLTPDVVHALRRRTQTVLTWPVDSADGLEDAQRLGVGGVISKSSAILGTVLAARQV